MTWNYWQKIFGWCTLGYFSNDKWMDFSQILGFKHILDKVTLGAFCQFFHPVWVILAHLRKTDASQNCWRLLSAIFKRASFNHQNRITSCKMKVSQFLWNQKWFQVTYFQIWWNLNWFHRFIVILVVFFFVTWFHGPKISYFLAKNHHKRGFIKKEW